LYDPARWFQYHDPKAYIFLEDDYDAFSGGGIQKDKWNTIWGSLYFWNPDATIQLIERNEITKVQVENISGPVYILSTHELSEYYQPIHNIFQNLPVNPMKNQQQVDWCIYQVK
jgi:hypothetical protein